VVNGPGRGFDSPRLHQNSPTCADNPPVGVLIWSHLLIGLSVLTLGVWWTRASVPLGRAMHRLRWLLWLSIGAKGVVWGALYAQHGAVDPPLAALGLLLGAPLWERLPRWGLLVMLVALAFGMLAPVL
jgi:hypothetical protein